MMHTERVQHKGLVFRRFVLHSSHVIVRVVWSLMHVFFFGPTCSGGVGFHDSIAAAAAAASPSPVLYTKVYKARRPWAERTPCLSHQGVAPVILTGSAQTASLSNKAVKTR